MKLTLSLSTLFILSFVLALTVVNAQTETLYEEKLDNGNHPLDNGWMGDYFGDASSWEIREDVNVSYTYVNFGKPTPTNQQKSIAVKDEAALVRTFSTNDYENIVLEYCRAVPGAVLNKDDSSLNAINLTLDALFVGWKDGTHRLIKLNSKEYLTEWPKFNQLEKVEQHEADCVSFNLPDASADRDDVTIAFYFNGNTFTGYVNEIKVLGDKIVTTTNSGGGSSGGGSSGGGSTQIIPPSDGPQICISTWVCEDWSECTSGEQSRICNDLNSCSNIDDRPEVVRNCVEPVEDVVVDTQPISEDTSPLGITGAVIGANGVPTPLGFLILLILLAIAGYYASTSYKKKNLKK